MNRLVLLVAVVLTAVGSAGAEIYVVNPDGTGDFPTIQAALDAAVDGDIIELLDGVFVGDGNRDVLFLGKAVTVRSQSGDPEACVIDCEGSADDHHRGFVFDAEEGTESVLQGIKIVNGYIAWPDGQGGAVLCHGASPTIGGCVFEGNWCAAHGGAINCLEGASPAVTGCSFVRNTADSNGGGGIALRDGANATVTDCIFLENATDRGGGICCWNSSPTIIRCDFVGNTCRQMGGGVHYQEYSCPQITDCYFAENWAPEGGGLFCWDASSAEITNCVFEDNFAYHHGGGVACYMGSPRLTGCVLSGNHAEREGGGLRSGWSHPEIVDCSFFDNSANQGGGILSWRDLFLESCTIYDNLAEVGGGLYANDGVPWLVQCTIYGNTAPTGAGTWCGEEAHVQLRNTIIAFCVGGEAIGCDVTGATTLSCCDIYGNEGGDWIGCIADQLGIDGNISEHPLFCAPEVGDFTIAENSPCAPYSPPNPECDLIGAWSIGCGPASVPDEPLSPGQQAVGVTWGRLKHAFGR